MQGSAQLSAADFGSLFKEFLERALASETARPEPVFVRRLRTHLGTDPTALPVVRHEFESSELANAQLALEAYLDSDGREADPIGVAGQQARYAVVRLADLLASARTG